jgi:hypothetical protein
LSVESLSQALLEAGILEATAVEARAARSRSGRQLLDAIVSEGEISESSLVSQLARALSVPRYDPRERQPEPEAMALLDVRQSDELGVLPVAVRGGGTLLWVAMCDPTDESLSLEVTRRTGRRVKACLVGPGQLSRALHQAGVAAQHGAAPMPPQPVHQSFTPRPGTVPPMPMGYPTPMPMHPHPMGAMGYPTPMPGQFPGYFGAPMAVPSMMGQVPMPPGAAVGGKSAELQKLEDELAQAKQVIRVLTQLLVERSLIDGDELKRRLRAERDRR